MHTDRFTPLDAATLLRWMQHDLPNKQLFGIRPGAFLYAEAG